MIEEINAHLVGFGEGPDGIIMTNVRRGPVTRSAFGNCWREAAHKAGLPKGTRFHALRHFYGSALLDAGVNPKIVQARMRHASFAETMDAYAHKFRGADDAGREAIGATLGSRGPAVDQAAPAGVNPQVSDGAAGELTCRPGSVRPLARAGGHPSRAAVAGSLERSTRELGRAALDRSRRSSSAAPS